MNFYDDKEKMRDFRELTKISFLESYSYLNENDYLDTQKEVNKQMKINIEKVKDYIVKNKQFMAMNLYYYQKDNFDEKLTVQNCLLYLAEQYNIKIPEDAKDFIQRKVVFYIPKENTYTFINKEYKGEKNVEVKEYLQKIKEKVLEERTLSLEFIGKDNYERPVYKDAKGNLYKDTSLGKDDLLKSLAIPYKNKFEGEPYILLGSRSFIINTIDNRRLDNTIHHFSQIPEFIDNPSNKQMESRIKSRQKKLRKKDRER